MLLLILGVWVAVLPLAAGQCYGQGSKTTSDLLCDTGSNPTFCCPAFSVCLSNGICNQKGKLSIGSCSDPAWPGPCLSDCPAGSTIINCAPVSAGNYCCATNKNDKNGQDKCCSGDTFDYGELLSASTLPFTKLATSTSTKPASTSSQKTTSTSATAKSTSKKSSTGSSSTDSTSSESSTSTSSAPQTTQSSQASTTTVAGANVLSTVSQTSTSTPIVAAAAASKSMSTGAKIGAGIGGALGIAFIGFAIFLIMFLFRRRRQDKINAIRLSALRAKAETSSGGSFAFSTLTRHPDPSLIPSPSAREPPPQYSKPLPQQPRGRIATMSESEHLLSTQPSSFNPPHDQPSQTTAPAQMYRAYQPPPSPRRMDVDELGFPLVAPYTPLFSELVTPTSPSPTSYPPPLRVMTPAEELAAARLRSSNREAHLSPQSAQSEHTVSNTGELRRGDSVVSELSAQTRDRERAALSRGNSVVSGRTEFSRGAIYEM